MCRVDLAVGGLISTNFISEIIVLVEVYLGPILGVQDASKCKAVGDSVLSVLCISTVPPKNSSSR
jgi:hypothetical protein